jgi:hypothetical protein
MADPQETVYLRKRHRYEHGYFIADNQLAQDPALSFRAIGVGCFLWSMPDDYPINAEKIAEDRNKDRPPEERKEGRDAVRNALNELVAGGYLRRTKVSRGRGQWIHTAELADQPIFRNGAGQFSDGESAPEPDQSQHGKPAGQFSDGVSGADNPALSTKGPPASPNGDGGSRRRSRNQRKQEHDGRVDTLVGKCVEAMGGRPVEIGAFVGIVTNASKAGVPEAVIARECAAWWNASKPEPISWLTNRLGDAQRRHAKARRARERRAGHDHRHDPGCWCWDGQPAAPPPRAAYEDLHLPTG